MPLRTYPQGLCIVRDSGIIKQKQVDFPGKTSKSLARAVIGVGAYLSVSAQDGVVAAESGTAGLGKP